MGSGEAGGAPVWIHTDLLRPNLLVGDGRLRAVIDFGGYRGCPHEGEFRAMAASRGIDVLERWWPAEESA